MTTKTVRRAYKFRFYPTPEQESLLAQTFGCVRVVWNHVLAERQRRWQQEGLNTSQNEASKLLTALKREPEFEWLNDVSSVPLQQTLRHQDKAFSRFFSKKGGYPKFKSRKFKQSAHFTQMGFSLKDDGLYIAKSREPLNVRWSREIPASDPSSLTITKDRAGRYFVSMLFEEQIVQLKKTKSKVGIDLGLTHFAVTSDGEKIENPRLGKAEAARIARLQRAYAKKEKGSRNQEKARLKVARASARVADRRRDFLHKLSTKLVRENQTIVLEDLAVQNMSARGNRQKRGLSRSITDASWSEFRSMLTYKSDWYGRELIVIDRWFPSSQICSACGVTNGRKELSVRRWKCKSCNAWHDRDVNAVKNILAAGTAVSVCEDGRRRSKTSV